MSYKHSASEYNQAADGLNEAVKNLDAAMSKMVEAEKATADKVKTAVARSKDMAGQLGDSLSRVNRILGGDFENRLNQLERMTNALSTLTDLERSGSLQNVMKAIGGTAK